MSFDLEPYILLLAAEFKRHDKRGHLQHLRRYWSARQARKRTGPRGWDDDFVIEWLALFRIPPFDVVYPVRDRTASCSRCSSTQDVDVKVTCIFPGGHKAQCIRCREEWLVLEEKPA